MNNRCVSTLTPSHQHPLLAASRLGIPALAPFFERTASSEIPVDLFENDTHYVAVFETPGRAKSDLLVNVDEGRLQISYRAAAEDGEVEVPRSRSLDLPRGIDEEGIVAKSKDGLLTVSIPKKDERKDIRIS